MSIKSQLIVTANGLALGACRRSWRVYNSVSIVVDDRGIRLPVGRAVGLDMIGKKSDLQPVISWAYNRRSGLFVDAGANVGRTLVALLRYNRTIPYIGFEPAIQAAANVSSIIRENGLWETHSILPVGLSDRHGHAILYSNGDADVSATINHATRPVPYTRRTVIAVGVGDDYLGGEKSVAFLKVDVEGAEVPVLRGFAETLRIHKPVVYTEVLPIRELELNTYSREALGNLSDEDRKALIEERRKHATAIRDILHEHGYTLCKLRGSELAMNADVMQASCDDYDFLGVPASMLPRS